MHTEFLILAAVNYWTTIAIGIGIVIFIFFAILMMVSKFYRKVNQGQALLINKMGANPEVTFTGGIVLPVIHRAEIMDIFVKTIELERRGKEGLICRDNIRADIKVTFFVQVNKTPEDVLKVAQSIGCQRASDQETVEELFVAKFSEALKTIGKRMDFEELYTKRNEFKDQIVDIIGTDLNGYSLENVAIDYLEQTPLDLLDENNILDSQGIRKITEITAEQQVETAKLKAERDKKIGSENLSKKEALLAFELQEKQAEAQTQSQIAIAHTQEAGKAERQKHEEYKKNMLAKQKAEQEVMVHEQDKLRAIEVAQKNRELEIAREAVRVQKARDLEEVSREREVEIQQIEKEKILEVKNKEIKIVQRERIEVEKGAAEAEEKIKELRVLAEAERQRKAKIIAAEASAQEQLVKNIKAAEAQMEVAKFESQKKIVLAEAELDTADKLARAKIRLSEGIQAEAAAKGLAEVKVKEANAQAIEREGLAKAKVVLETMQAEATGQEHKGMAEVKIKEAHLSVIEREGLVKAQITKEQLKAEAIGIEEKGLAEAKIKEAEATAIEKLAQAEATAIREKLNAEAAGLAEKAQAMKALDEVGRSHEEFRLQLEAEKSIALERIRVQREIAQAQAEVLSRAFENAKINIVGGDGAFFDTFIRAVSLGQSVDAFVDHSESAKHLLKDYLEGDGSLTKDLKEILSNPAVSSDTVQNLTVSALLGKMMLQADPSSKSKLRALMRKARELGLENTSVSPQTPKS